MKNYDIHAKCQNLNDQFKKNYCHLVNIHSNEISR